MSTSKTIKKFLAICLALVMTFGVCGCSKIFDKDERTKEEYQAEATEISAEIVKRMIEGNYDPIDKYFSSADSSSVEEIVNNIDKRLEKESLVTVVSVYTDPDSYATDVQFQISLYFGGHSSSTTCYMRLRRSGGGWVVANGGSFARDIEALNSRFVQEKMKELGEG